MKKYYVAKSLCIFQTLSKAGLVCVCGVLKSFCNLISPEDQASGLFLQLAKHLQILVHCPSPLLYTNFFKHIMLSISLLVKIKSKCHLKFKFAFILSFKLYTDGDCIEKKLRSTGTH